MNLFHFCKKNLQEQLLLQRFLKVDFRKKFFSERNIDADVRTEDEILDSYISINIFFGENNFRKSAFKTAEEDVAMADFLTEAKKRV